MRDSGFIPGDRSLNTSVSNTPHVIVDSGDIVANAGTNLNTSLLALESGGNLAGINAKLVSGTDIGDVTINNSTGAAAVNIQDGGNTITVDGTVASTQSGAPWTVDLTKIAGASAAVSGGTEATSLRVTIATDSTGLLSVDDNGGSLTVDVGTALPAGTNAIGKLAANSGVDVGDVTINNSTGAAAVNVQDGGNSLTVDVGTALPAGTNAIGKLSANSGVDIGDVDVTSLPNVKPNALKILDTSSYDVDNSAILVVDASAHATMTSVTICNAGDGDVYLYPTNGVTIYVSFKTLAPGEAWEFPLGYTSDTTNDIYAVRGGAETNDNVVVVKWCEV